MDDKTHGQELSQTEGREKVNNALATGDDGTVEARLQE